MDFVIPFNTPFFTVLNKHWTRWEVYARDHDTYRVLYQPYVVGGGNKYPTRESAVGIVPVELLNRRYQDRVDV